MSDDTNEITIGTKDGLLGIDIILKNAECNKILMEYCAQLKTSEDAFIMKYETYLSMFSSELQVENDMIMKEKNFIYACLFLVGRISTIVKSGKIDNYDKHIQLASWFLYRKLNDVFIINNKADEEDISLFNLNSSKGTEKTIMLYKLGIIDFLRGQVPFSTSTNSLAKVLSIITGEKLTTMQSYLNPIISDGVDQKNNPLKSEKTVEKVNEKLISLGYKFSK